MNRKRLLFLDIIRGITVLHMILYHLLYDVEYIFGQDIGWFGIRESYTWEQYICWSFILISGISFRYSRKPWKNGIRLLVCALILTVVTSVAMPSQIIWFGVLHFLGFALLIAWLLKPIIQKIPAGIGMIVFFIAFLFLKNIQQGVIGINGIWEYPLPDVLYQSSFLFGLGFPNAQFVSSDYFPILPWIFLFLTGYYGGVFYDKGNEWVDAHISGFRDNRIYQMIDKSFGLVGRKSLWIYMLHQPIVYRILLVCQMCGVFS